MQVVWKTPLNNPRYLPRTVKKKIFYFNQHRPWSIQFSGQNNIGNLYPKVFVEPIKEWSFFKGDRVSIISQYGKCITLKQQRNNYACIISKIRDGLFLVRYWIVLKTATYGFSCESSLNCQSYIHFQNRLVYILIKIDFKYR